MNKRFFVTTLVAAGGMMALSATAFAGQATQTANQPAATPASQSAAKPLAAAPRAVPPRDSNQCIRETGSRIRPPKGQCLPVPGNSYSQQDIRRTGAVNMGRALQMLDPSITVHGH